MLFFFFARAGSPFFYRLDEVASYLFPAIGQSAVFAPPLLQGGTKGAEEEGGVLDEPWSAFLSRTNPTPVSERAEFGSPSRPYHLTCFASHCRYAHFCFYPLADGYKYSFELTTLALLCRVPFWTRLWSATLLLARSASRRGIRSADVATPARTGFWCFL